MRKTKIECSPEVRELNEAVETADLLTDYHFDWTTGEQLAGVLEGQGCPYHAADLRNKLAEVYRPIQRLSPCDKHAENFLKSLGMLPRE